MPNALVDEIEQKRLTGEPLSPGAQQAAARSLPMVMPQPGSAAGSPAPGPFDRPNGTAAGGLASSPVPSTPALKPMPGPETPGALPGAAEYNRLSAAPRPDTDTLAHTKYDTGRSGIGQIHNPVVRTLAGIGDALGSAFLPGLTMNIPGTSLHHQQLLNRQAGVVDQQQANAMGPIEQRKATAAAAEQESLPALHEAQGELKASQLANTITHQKSEDDIAREKEAGRNTRTASTRSSSLAQHGFSEDENGQIIPLPYDKMSEQQQAVHDLTASRKEEMDAQAALKKAQKDGIPAAAQLAQSRIANAQHNSQIAERRLGLAEKEYEANYHGTEGGQPLPGAPADEAGNPIGLKTAGITKPPAAVQGRAAQAGVILDVGTKLKAAIAANKDLFGNLGSYWKQAVNGTPISDPRAAKMMAEIASYVALHPAAHGFRSTQALQEFAKVTGGIPKNGDALIAAIEGYEPTMESLKKGGTMHTVQPGGGAAAPAGGTIPTVTTKAEFDKLPSGAVYMEDGKKYRKP